MIHDPYDGNLLCPCLQTYVVEAICMKCAVFKSGNFNYAHYAH